MPDRPSGIPALDRLAHDRGVDVRPALVRALADLFVQAKSRTAADIARFAELMTQLIETADGATRRALAVKLAPCPDAPRAVLERLMRDDVEIAAIVIERAAALPPERLAEIAIDGGPCEAAAVARRTDLSADVAHLLAANPHPLVREALAGNRAARLDRAAFALIVDAARDDAELAGLVLDRDDVPAELLAPLYADADARRRAEIRAAAARSAAPVMPPAAEAVQSLLRLSPQGWSEEVPRLLLAALRLPPDLAPLLATDASGHLMTLAMRAAGLEREAIIELLLRSGLEAARDVDRLFELARVAEDTTRAAAHRIVAAVAGGDLAARPAGRHEPALDGAEGVQRPVAERIRRPLPTARRTTETGRR